MKHACVPPMTLMPSFFLYIFDKHGWLFHTKYDCTRCSSLLAPILSVNGHIPVNKAEFSCTMQTVYIISSSISFHVSRVSLTSIEYVDNESSTDSI